MLLPGVHFQTMNKVCKDVQGRNIHDNFAKYHEERELWLKTYKAPYLLANFPTIEETIEQREQEQARALSLHFAALALQPSYMHPLLTDEQFAIAVGHIFGTTPKTIPLQLSYTCPLCKNKICETNHPLVCEKLIELHTHHHNLIVNSTIRVIKQKYMPCACKTAREIAGDENRL